MIFTTRCARDTETQRNTEEEKKRVRFPILSGFLYVVLMIYVLTLFPYVHQVQSLNRSLVLLRVSVSLAQRVVKVLFADGPKPEVKSVSALGLRAGRTTSLVIYGENLAPKEITVKPPLTVKLGEVKATDEKTKGKGSRQVAVEVTVPANCPRENFDLVLTQPDGAKANASIAIVDDAAQEIPIKKPAATFAQAMPIPGPSVALTGSLDGDTADVFRLDAKAGETWDISLLCGRGGSPLDPVLRVRDKRHFSLLLSAGDKKKDRHLVFKPTADGPYYIEITEGEARGGPEYAYRLTVTRK